MSRPIIYSDQDAVKHLVELIRTRLAETKEESDRSYEVDFTDQHNNYYSARVWVDGVEQVHILDGYVESTQVTTLNVDVLECFVFTAEDEETDLSDMLQKEIKVLNRK